MTSNQNKTTVVAVLGATILLLGISSRPSPAQEPAAAATVPETESWNELLDESLSKWESYIGVPHSSVTGLPTGTAQSDDITKGTPLGLNNDLKNVYTTSQDDGQIILHVSGEIFGGLTTKDSFENYHLSLQQRWGEKKWQPRADKIRDSGILYHCHGKHGAFWHVWKSCLECQVQEKDYGDLYLIVGTKAIARASAQKGKKELYFDPTADYQSRRVRAWPEVDVPNGHWNQIDLYVLGDQAIHVVNGQVVLAIKDARKKDGTKLDRGQIQLQSEGAECEYKNVRIRPIDSFPAKLKQAANL